MRLPLCSAMAVWPAADLWTWFSAGQGGFGGQGGFAGGSSPYGDAGQMYGSQPPPRKSSKVWLWLLLGLGGLGVAALVCCGAVGIWGMGALNNVMTQAMQEELGGNPIIQQHIGQIESVSINIGATQKLQQGGGNDGAAVMDIRGDKGSGQLIILQRPGQQPTIDLKLPSGETFNVK